MATQIRLRWAGLVGMVWGLCGCGASTDRTDHASAGVRGERLQVGDTSYWVVRMDTHNAHLRLFWKDENGNRFGSFEKLAANFAPQKMIFAANAGIFDSDFSPCGWHKEEGRELIPLNASDGEGNFYLKPNGVLVMDDSGAHIVESSKASGYLNGRLAVQSGPLLLEDGRIHPAFKQQSNNRVTRSGAGVAPTGELCFVLSEQPVNFFEFALVFKDRLSCRDALYLDGSISRFYAPDLDLRDMNGDFAGILAVFDAGPPMDIESHPK